MDPSRYSRQLRIPEVGSQGQERLGQARVLIVGVGGLGSPAAIYLAAAGLGTLGLIDDDTVDISNLHRQILYKTNEVGKSKVECAVETLAGINPEVNLEPYQLRLIEANASDLIGQYDLVIDGSDNFETRYVVNDACVRTGKPNVYGSVFRFDGQVSVFGMTDGPCYRCVFPEPPEPGTVPNCAESGVLGVLPGIVGTIQATEAIKLILGVGSQLVGRLLVFDALTMSFREVAIERSVDCPLCGSGPTRTAVASLADVDSMSPSELRARLGSVTVLDVREKWEVEAATFPNAVHIPLNLMYADRGHPRHTGAKDPASQCLTRDDPLLVKGPIVVICHHGMRSAAAVRLLLQRGHTDVWNLEGGIDAYSREVDPSIARY